jgi:hypothetical protein
MPVLMGLLGMTQTSSLQPYGLGLRRGFVPIHWLRHCAAYLRMRVNECQDGVMELRFTLVGADCIRNC